MDPTPPIGFRFPSDTIILRRRGPGERDGRGVWIPGEPVADIEIRCFSLPIPFREFGLTREEMPEGSRIEDVRKFILPAAPSTRPTEATADPYDIQPLRQGESSSTGDAILWNGQYYDVFKVFYSRPRGGNVESANGRFQVGGLGEYKLQNDGYEHTMVWAIRDETYAA